MGNASRSRTLPHTAGSGAAQAVAGASVALVAVARSALLGSLVT